MKIFLSVLIFSVSVTAFCNKDLESTFSRAFSFYNLNLYDKAYSEINSCFKKDVSDFSPENFVLAMDIAAAIESEKNIERVWKLFNSSKYSSNLDCFRTVLESRCKGIVNSLVCSKDETTRLASIIAAGYSNSLFSVEVLQKTLNDHSCINRKAAAFFSSKLGDEALIKRLVVQLAIEQTVEGRIQLIKILQEFNISGFADTLLDIINNDSLGNLERSVAAKAFVIIKLKNGFHLDFIKELNNLFLNKALCCCCIEFPYLQKDFQYIFESFLDIPESRAHVLKAISSLDKTLFSGQFVEKIANFIEDKNFEVSIFASRFLAIHGYQKALDRLEYLSKSNDPRIHSLASAVVVSLGDMAKDLSLKLLTNSRYQSVKVNVAFGLIANRIELEQSANILAELLNKKECKFFFDKSYLISPIRIGVPSCNEFNVNLCGVEDSMARLEILNLLAHIDYPFVKEQMRTWLKSKKTTVALEASSEFLEDGDKVCFDVVRNLLYDEDPNVRIMAAIVVSSIAKDDLAIKALQDMYPHQSKEMKIKIIETLFSLNNAESLDFLIKCLDEKIASIRVLAAGAILGIIKL